MTDFAMPSTPGPEGTPARSGPPPGDATEEARLRRAAREFEAVFLAEMLNHAGLAETPESFGGGAGEDAFASLLVREHARAIAERGGIGLAEALFDSLLERTGGT